MNFPRSVLEEARFWARVAVPADVDACWEWRGKRNAKGYGLIAVDGRFLRAHRVVLQLCSGKAPPASLMSCHTCDNPRCVSPLHLFLGTNADNQADMRAKGRGYVPHGKQLRGEDHPRAKLTARQVRAIRAALERGACAADLARRFGVSASRISSIRHGRAWVLDADRDIG